MFLWNNEIWIFLCRYQKSRPLRIIKIHLLLQNNFFIHCKLPLNNFPVNFLFNLFSTSCIWNLIETAWAKRTKCIRISNSHNLNQQLNRLCTESPATLSIALVIFTHKLYTNTSRCITRISQNSTTRTYIYTWPACNVLLSDVADYKSCTKICTFPRVQRHLRMSFPAFQVSRR